MTCKTGLVTSKREQQEAAGRWLRQARERKGFATAAALAQRMGVSVSLVSRYETGLSAISDERAQQIAEALGMDLFEVRRGLGLWVPETITGTASATLSGLSAHAHGVSTPEHPEQLLDQALELIRRARELGRPGETPEERLRESLRAYRRLISEAADGMDEIDEAIHGREAG